VLTHNARKYWISWSGEEMVCAEAVIAPEPIAAAVTMVAVENFIMDAMRRVILCKVLR
jgi:hypothetical protein